MTVTTCTIFGFLDQNLHQEYFPLSCAKEGAVLESCSSSCETSTDLSLQLRGTHPLLTRIGNCTLEYIVR